jgi:hypothetical protein
VVKVLGMATGMLLFVLFIAGLLFLVSLVVGALWNMAAPGFGLMPIDVVTAYAATLLLYIVGRLVRG